MWDTEIPVQLAIDFNIFIQDLNINSINKTNLSLSKGVTIQLFWQGCRLNKQKRQKVYVLFNRYNMYFFNMRAVEIETIF